MGRRATCFTHLLCARRLFGKCVLLFAKRFTSVAFLVRACTIVCGMRYAPLALCRPAPATDFYHQKTKESGALRDM